MKYSKGITICKLHITVTDKDSFEECDKCIIEALDRHPEIDKEIKQQFIKEVLS